MHIGTSTTSHLPKHIVQILPTLLHVMIRAQRCQCMTLQLGLLPGFEKPVKTVFKYVMKKPIIEMYKPLFLQSIIY